MAAGGREAEPQTVALARSALQQGRQELARNNSTGALPWLERAHRLVPKDLNVVLTLAAACLPQDPARAATLFGGVTAAHDLREAWLGLAGARRYLGEMAAAAEAVRQLLSRHVCQADSAGIASDLARRIGAPGWCGIRPSRDIQVRPFSDGPIDVKLDGEPLAPNDAQHFRLPPAWATHASLSVTIGGRDCLGSPIDLRSIARTHGQVEAVDGGIRGWAWHPGDPATDPVLTISDAASGRRLRIVAAEPAADVVHAGPLATVRGFTVPAAMLADMTGPIHVRGRDRRDLAGSPVDPLAEQRAALQAALIVAQRYPADPTHAAETPILPPPALPADLPVPAKPVGAQRRRRQVDVVVPVHGQRDLTLACLKTLFATVSRPSRIIVVDDASSDSGLVAELDRLAREGFIRLIRHRRNLGFPASANAGIAASPRRDVVLLNSDTLTPPGWLERLREAVYSEESIGTATPFSNNASILSYPGHGDDNPIPDRAATIKLDRLARRANGMATVEIPVGVGFCLYLRRDCLDAVGRLRDDVFAQGYGEENDFCLRARRLGWRHVALPGVFVAHCAGKSFGATAQHLRARNQEILNRLHPGYDRLIETFARADPLAEVRRRFDLERWRQGRRRTQEAVVLITHDHGGGVEQRVLGSAAAHQHAGRRPIILRPSVASDGAQAVVLGDDTGGGFPNLRYRLPAELPALLRLLRAERVALVEAHHFLGHHPEMHQLAAELAVPCEVHVHDYAWFCPRISLVGGHGRYCGEPGPRACQRCIDDHGRFISEDITVAELRRRSRSFLRAASRIVAPSQDTADRIVRHFHDVSPVVIPHEDDSAIRVPEGRHEQGRIRACVLGAIGIHKGYDVLLACARDAADRSLDLEFVVVGSTIDDSRLLATGRVFVTGSYHPQEYTSLIAAQRAQLGFLPSIWPETWCMALTELWRAGLRVAAFDLGAPAERIRRTGNGFLLPLHLPANAINNALIASVASNGCTGVVTRMRSVSNSDPSRVVIQPQ
ncbi:MAG: glycosyltransferase [Acetobacteraceae bacterium]